MKKKMELHDSKYHANEPLKKSLALNEKKGE